MNTRHNYKGRIIESRIYPLRDGGWTAHFSIEDHLGYCVLDTPFETGQRFPTRNAALGASIRMGMDKIESRFETVISG